MSTTTENMSTETRLQCTRDSQLQSAPVEVEEEDESDISLWEKCVAHADEHNSWITGHYLEKSISLKINAVSTEWKIQSQIGREKNFRWEYEARSPYESSAVFNCVKVGGDEGPSEAVLKIYMQIPGPRRKHYQEVPYKRMRSHIRTEIEALERMKQLEASAPGPQLLAHRRIKQGSKKWVPDGYVHFLLLEKLPGVPLSSEVYWTLSAQERADIRAAFKVSWEAMVNDLKISHHDAALRNLLWDQQHQKCYIVDYEGAEFLPEEGRSWMLDSYYWMWGLHESLS